MKQPKKVPLSKNIWPSDMVKWVRQNAQSLKSRQRLLPLVKSYVTKGTQPISPNNSLQRKPVQKKALFRVSKMATATFSYPPYTACLKWGLGVKYHSQYCSANWCRFAPGSLASYFLMCAGKNRFAGYSFPGNFYPRIHAYPISDTSGVVTCYTKVSSLLRNILDIFHK